MEPESSPGLCAEKGVDLGDVQQRREDSEAPDLVREPLPPALSLTFQHRCLALGEMLGLSLQEEKRGESLLGDCVSDCGMAWAGEFPLFLSLEEKHEQFPQHCGCGTSSVRIGLRVLKLSASEWLWTKSLGWGQRGWGHWLK